MVGNKSLQRIRIKMLRSVYVDSRVELKQGNVGPLLVKRADRHLPHNRPSGILYEVSMPEVICGGDWVEQLKPKDDSVEVKPDSLSVYEMGTPLLLRALMHLGSVCRPNSGRDAKSGVYDLSELSPVVCPSDGEYLHSRLAHRRIYFYENLNHKRKSGLVGVFVMDPASGESLDLTRPQAMNNQSFEMSATCHIWVVKPGGKKVQKNITIKQCESMFGQLLSQLQELASREELEENGSSEYACLSPDSKCVVSGLNYAGDERTAFAGADEVLKSYLQSNNGPTFLLVNSTKPQAQLRKLVPSCNSFPFIPLAFPPGPAHNPSTNVLPALNWEPTAVQLCLEAYLHMGVVSYPKRVSSSRFAQVPIGNLGADENSSMFDVLYARSLNKSRAVLWASSVPSSPDLGIGASSLVGKSGGGFWSVGSGFNGNDIWSDDDALVSPVIAKPGAYRSVCVELDINNLCIGALTDSSLAVSSSAVSANQNSSIFEAESQAPNQILSSAAPLGDEMSTAISLPVLRALIHSWLREAYQTNNISADDLLHDIYRLISAPDMLLNDPALHRVVHSLMKTTFLRLLGELQRLGSTVVSADFRKVVIATNKSNIYDAREYVEFVISTILKRAGGEAGGASHTAEGLGRISLHPNNFYAHYLFLDQNNFGGIHFEQREIEDEDENEITQLFNSVSGEAADQSIVPAVVCGWNIKHYLSDNLAQDYFRTIIGRFSKDVFRKQLQIEHSAKSKIDSISPMSVAINDEAKDEDGFLSPQEQLLNYKKKMISKHFAHYLTRVVSELLEDDGGAEKFPKLPGSYLNMTNPALEFVKNVLAVLNLDSDVKQEVIYLKKSLFAQIGVHEYSAVTEWKNPAASFMLPDVYCSECRECRDVDLCVIPPDEEESVCLENPLICYMNSNFNQPFAV